MASKRAGAPAFIKEYYFGQIKERLPEKLEEVRADFLDETTKLGRSLNIPLPTPDLARTKPSSFPNKSNMMVIYTQRTSIGELRQAPHGSLEKIQVAPGKAGYESAIIVEYYCRGAIPTGGLRGYEVLNIQCQNTLWAAYEAVIDIADKSSYDVALEDGLTFDNTRGEEFPLTEWGMFRFYPTVR